MADNTHIEWTDATWNPITGCSVVSPGCTNCYAMRLAGTRLRDHPTRAGLTTQTKAGPVWNGQVRLIEGKLDEPLRWKRPRRIFVCAHGDLFHESVPDAWIDRVFAVMALCPQHTFQVLTKRAERMRAYFGAGPNDRVGEAMAVISDAADRSGVEHEHPGWMFVREPFWLPLPNVWLGVSVEDQTRADERIPILLDTPAAVRWISAEPLLGGINFNSSLGGTLWIGGQRGHEGKHHGTGAPGCPKQLHHHHDDRCERGLDWVVVGGESGPGARPMHPDWARQIRDDCAAAGVPFLFKQWGEWAEEGEHLSADTPENLRLRSGDRAHVFAEDHRQMARVGKRAAGRTLDGVTHDAYPAAAL